VPFDQPLAIPRKCVPSFGHIKELRPLFFVLSSAGKMTAFIRVAPVFARLFHN